MFAILKASDIHYHVNLTGAEIDRDFGFVTLGIGVHCAERETDHCADLHVAVFQERIGELHAAAINTDGGELVLGSLCAQLL